MGLAIGGLGLPDADGVLGAVEHGQVAAFLDEFSDAPVHAGDAGGGFGGDRGLGHGGDGPVDPQGRGDGFFHRRSDDHLGRAVTGGVRVGVVGFAPGGQQQQDDGRRHRPLRAHAQVQA